MHRFLWLATVAITFTHSAHADIIYEFSGALTTGSSSHTGILDTEDWTARFLIDDSFPDMNADPNVGAYLSSVRAATVTFSGGFTKSLAFDAALDPLEQFGVDVSNDNFGFDAVGAFLADGVFLAPGTASISASALSLDLSTIADDTLPGAGLSFLGDIGTFDFTDNDGQSVSFVGSDVSFVASVPEPGSVGLLSLLALGFIGRRCRKNHLRSTTA